MRRKQPAGIRYASARLHANFAFAARIPAFRFLVDAAWILRYSRNPNTRLKPGHRKTTTKQPLRWGIDVTKISNLRGK